jgi:hypothetical protein
MEIYNKNQSESRESKCIVHLLNQKSQLEIGKYKKKEKKKNYKVFSSRESAINWQRLFCNLIN